MKLSRRGWMALTAIVAVAGIVLSNLPFMGPSGKVSGEGSSIASSISWHVGAASAVVFVVLCAVVLVDRRRTSAGATEHHEAPDHHGQKTRDAALTRR